MKKAKVKRKAKPLRVKGWKGREWGLAETVVWQEGYRPSDLIEAEDTEPVWLTITPRRVKK